VFSRTASRIAVAGVSALIATGALAIPAVAQTSPIGPDQYFYGQVFGIASSSAQQGVIEVACTTVAETGHPLPGQFVEVQQVFPPVTTTLGFTGNFGAEINADLIWSQGTITVATPIATFTSYGVSVQIPTSITVPCSGTGVMNFAPYPDPDNSGIASSVDVTFESPGE
jgi:predicted enzyme related to lactoylglutathione lyase